MNLFLQEMAQASSLRNVTASSCAFLCTHLHIGNMQQSYRLWPCQGEDAEDAGMNFCSEVSGDP